MAGEEGGLGLLEFGEITRGEDEADGRFCEAGGYGEAEASGASGDDDDGAVGECGGAEDAGEDGGDGCCGGYGGGEGDGVDAAHRRIMMLREWERRYSSGDGYETKKQGRLYDLGGC